MAVEKNPRSDGEYLNSLARGLAVLRAFNKDKPEMTLSELAAETELNPAVVRRCLNTLVHLGYVAKRDKKFVLRPAVFSLGTAYIESMNLDEIVRPALQRVRDNTGYSTALAVMSGQEILLLAYVSTKMLTRVVAGVGTRFPVYATAGGRVLLAYQNDKAREEYLSNTEFQAFTDKTVTSKKELKSILSRVREDAYSSITGELDFGLVSIAVPVFDNNRRIVAAIACSASTNMTSEQQMIEKDMTALIAAAQEIELELRHSPMLVHSITA